MRRLVVAALALLAMAAGQTTEGRAGAASAGCARRWTILPAPRPDRSAELTDVAVVSRHDVWVAGGTNMGTLFEHWDGSAWSLVDAPSPPDGGVVIGLAALSADDVWAAGNSGPGPFFEHWDGSAWSLVDAPFSPRGEFVVDVAAASSSDVWAVGSRPRPGSVQPDPLVEHWDGSAWTVVPVPASVTRGEYLSGVAAISADDVWAVGSSHPGDGVFTATLVLHWDGSAWSRIPSPNPAEHGPNGLASVAAVAPDDAWAVGWYTGGDRALIEHWDGTRWAVVPNPGGGGLSSVATLGPSDVRAVGSTTDDRPVFMGWDGSRWSIQPSPPTPKPHVHLSAVDAGDGRFFAAGNQWTTIGKKIPLIERACPSGGVPGTGGRDRWRGRRVRGAEIPSAPPRTSSRPRCPIFPWAQRMRRGGSPHIRRGP